MPAPLLLIVGPVLPAALTFLLRRWRLAATIAGLASLLGLRLLLGTLPVAEGSASDGLFSNATWLVLGRSFVLTEQIKAAFILVYGALALVILVTLLLPQGTMFVPPTLLLLSPLASALMVQPAAFGMVLLLIAAGVIAVLIQNDRPGSTLAALRSLKMVALAVPSLLIAGWMIDAEQASFLATISRLFLAGFVILLAGFPFHIWVAPLSEEAQPLAPAVVFGVAQFVIVLFGLNLLNENPFVQANEQFNQALRLSAVATLLLAAVQALAAQTFGRLLGYLLLLDVGVVLLLLTLRVPAAQEAIVLVLLQRIAALLLSGFGLSMIRRQAESTMTASEQIVAMSQVAWRTPLGLALFVIGCLSLAGLPLTPGFAGRWTAIALVREQSTSLAILLLLSSAVGALSLLRCLALLLSAERARVTWLTESSLLQGAAVVLLIAALYTVLFPQVLLTPAQRLAAPF